MFKAPLDRSRQPIARMTAFAWTSNMPSSRFMAVTFLSAEMSMTIVFNLYSIPRSKTISIKREAYSGPVNSSLNVWRPNPLWIHWFKIPPSSLSRSMINMLSIPWSFALAAAASPAGPPPTITKSYVFMAKPPYYIQQQYWNQRRFW